MVSRDTVVGRDEVGRRSQGEGRLRVFVVLRTRRMFCP